MSMKDIKKVLFLCTQNSARSQIAEAILNSKAGDKFIAYSAGSCPAEKINPYALLVIQELGIDASQYKPKSIEAFVGQQFDFIITLCDKVKNECPIVNEDTIYAHWGLSDLTYFTGTDEEILKQFKKIKSKLLNRINILLSLPEEKIDNAAIKKKISKNIADE